MPLAYNLSSIEGATITNGGGFSCTTGTLTSAIVGQVAHSIFNPANSGVVLYVVSIIAMTVQAGTMRGICGTTVDPNYANKLTPISNKINTAISSLANATFLNTAAANVGNQLLPISMVASTTQQFLMNNVIFVVPSGTGLVANYNVQANAWQSTFIWYEAT